jgi:hypothetical protein
LFGQQPVVPAGDLAQPIVGDHKGARLGRAQMLQTQGRHLGHAECTGGQEPPVPGDHLVIAVHQHRDVEAKGLDAADDLPDLLSAVNSRVRRV